MNKTKYLNYRSLCKIQHISGHLYKPITTERSWTISPTSRTLFCLSCLILNLKLAKLSRSWYYEASKTGSGMVAIKITSSNLLSLKI